QPVGLVDGTNRHGLRLFRHDVRRAVGEGGDAVADGAGRVEQVVGDVADAAGTVEFLAHGGGAHVLADGAAQAYLVGHPPVEATLPGPHLTRAAVLRPAGGAIEVQLLDQGQVGDQRHQELDEGLADVLLTACEGDVGELDFHRVARGSCPTRHTTDAKRRIVGHHRPVGRVGVHVATGAHFHHLDEGLLAVAVADGHVDGTGAPAFVQFTVQRHFPDVLVDVD